MHLFPCDTRAGATVLAALRFYQNHNPASLDVHEIATCGGTVEPLDRHDIDTLCEELNCGGGLYMSDSPFGDEITRPGDALLPQSVWQRACDLMAAAPAIPVGEGSWDDQDSANADGMRQANSAAAAILRDIFKALSLNAPAGVPVCPHCECDLADGHADDCEAPRFYVELVASSVQVTAASERQGERYALADLGDSTLEWNAYVADVTPAGLNEEADPGEWEAELAEGGDDDGTDSIWTFTGKRQVIAFAETAEEAPAAALKVLAEEGAKVVLIDAPAEAEDEPCPINRRPKGTCPAACDHGEG